MAVRRAARAIAGRVTMPARFGLVAGLALLLAGCVVVPRTVQVYDADCQITYRQMVMSVEQVGTFGHCRNEGCAAVLVALGAVATVTAVVSGSVVIVGNVVYWFEKRNLCHEGPR